MVEAVGVEATGLFLRMEIGGRGWRKWMEVKAAVG